MTAETKSITGGCRCGAVRYEVAVPRLPLVYACHCTDCQTWSGSAFSEQFFISEDLLTVTGKVVEYRFVNPMGRISVQRICPTCHTRLYNTNSSRPAIVVVRAGSLDHSTELDVRTHIWARSKQPWIRLPDGAVIFEEGLSAEALAALTASNMGSG